MSPNKNNSEDKHEEYINYLIEKRGGLYAAMGKKRHFQNGNGTDNGEIDFIGYILPDDKFDLYEVKTTEKKGRENKAKRQLKKAREYFEDNGCHIKGTYIFFGDRHELFLVGEYGAMEFVSTI